MSSYYLNWLAESKEKASLEKTLHYFSVFSGLKAELVDDSGNTLVSTENQVPDCRFCKIIKGDLEGQRKCRRSYARANREAAKYGEPYVFRCHAGLVAWAVPIMVGSHRCAIICGQVLMWEIEDFFLDEITGMVGGLDVDLNEVKQAALELNYLSGEKVQAVSELLFIIANQLMNKEGNLFSEQKSMTEYQAVLSDSIAARKKLEGLFPLGVGETKHSFSRNTERELISAIRSSDKDGMSKALDTLLVDIIHSCSNNLGEVKGRIVELMVNLSRAEMDGGINEDRLSSLNSKFYEELYQKTTMEEICYWTKKVVDIYFEEVRKAKNKDNFQAAYAAAEYIQHHFKEKISVQDIGESVHLSSSYLSHIFSSTFGRTISEYLTFVRIEYAKTLLAKPGLSISDVALESGFEDVSYFSRVFKKKEGMTPRVYKKKTIPEE